MCCDNEEPSTVAPAAGTHADEALQRSSTGIPVGIDMGTTRSVLAYLDSGGQLHSVPNPFGETRTPSVVLVDDNRILVGKEAELSALVKPDRVADAFKREMGEHYCRRAFLGQRIPPEIFGAILLKHLKQYAAYHLGPTDRAVIAVPACFGELRRAAVQNSARLAGWQVLDIINEPTAAALACGWRRSMCARHDPAKSLPVNQRLLVFDLGGGTFDVTLINIEGSTFRTIATAGDALLGGNDFDEQMVEHIAAEFREQHGVDPRRTAEDAAQLRFVAREAKHALFESEVVTLSCRSGNLQLETQIHRDIFEALSSALFDRMAQATQDLVRAAALSWREIDEVATVGGASRMPMVLRMLRELSGKEPTPVPGSHEAVAHGAALYAAMLSGRDTFGAQLQLINVNSHSVGVLGTDESTHDRVNAIIIPRNTPLPALAVKKFHTAREGQRTVEVPVVEGESKRPESCAPLGKLLVQDLPPNLPKGTVVEVECRIESNGRFAVSARIPVIGRPASAEIQRDRKPLVCELPKWEERLVSWSRECSYSKSSPSALAQRADGRLALDLSERSSIVRRLDTLFVEIGRQAIDCNVPPDARPAQRALLSTLQEVQIAKRTAAAARGRRDADDGTTEGTDMALKLTSDCEKQHKSEKRAEFAFLVLGRECVFAGFRPPGTEYAWQEAKDLQKLLQ